LTSLKLSANWNEQVSGDRKLFWKPFSLNIRGPKTHDCSPTRPLRSAPAFPALIADAEQATRRFLEFFTVAIRNANTGTAYGRAGPRQDDSKGASPCEPVGLARHFRTECTLFTRKAYTFSLVSRQLYVERW
jgi:hypothetical protein